MTSSRLAARRRSAARSRRHTVDGFRLAMERVAPVALAQDWDNVGLLAGDPKAELRRVLLCIDLTRAVVDEARRGRFNLVMAYHPPIFKPLSRLLASSPGTDALVFCCIEFGVAIYSTHTALDAAKGGTNDVLAGLCGAADTRPLEWSEAGRPSMCKFVVFVPHDSVDRVAEVMFAAGAGRIGEYTHCAFRTKGQGSFLGGEGANPAVGKKGRLEFVDETRLETVVPVTRLADVTLALRAAHPYEEPAFDIYPMKSAPHPGIGRVGRLPDGTTLGGLARRLKRATRAPSLQMVGDSGTPVRRVIALAGSAGSLWSKAGASEGDVIVTGEIRHHDALTIARHGASAIALGHWASERPVLAPLGSRLRSLLPGVTFVVSRADADPLGPIT